ncbi:cell division ATP-binding protein FtsE [Amnibacterium flavum]|uniref:cell division ATP-binding protein FtsE n=1 Tax=Amnibacterium flavum TaxID=2173173 RepID=UPI00362A3342
MTKLYSGNSKPALNGVDVEIKAGEFVFLVGASGSGKSSFLRLVLKEEKPTSGEIHVLGQRLSSISSRKIPYFRRSLGVVFQDFRLLPGRTVYQNVAFTLQVIGKSRGFIQEAVPDVLKMVGLDGKAERLPHELSGGEQQRVAIARAVVNKPAILLADEPTGNLDPTTSAGIMQVLELINAGGTTVVMATHDVGIVDTMKRRVIELTGGNIIRDEVEGGYTTSISLPTIPGATPAPAVTGAAAFAAAVAEEVGQIELPTSPRTVVETSAPEPLHPVTASVPIAYPGAVPTMTGVIPVQGDYEQYLPTGPVQPVRPAAAPAASAPAAQPAERTAPAEAPAQTAAHPVQTAQAAPAEPEVRTAAEPTTTSAPFGVTLPMAAPSPEPAPAPIAAASTPAPAAAPSTPSNADDDPLAFLRRRPAAAAPTAPARAGETAPSTTGRTGAHAAVPPASRPAADPGVRDDDPLALAVRLGLRNHGAAPESTGSQEVGPTE